MKFRRSQRWLRLKWRVLHWVQRRLNSLLILFKCTLTGLIREYEPQFGNVYFNIHEEGEWTFEGIEICDDDYYFVMVSPGYERRLFSCVGSLSSCGYILKRKRDELS